jgi:hypothetical protein
MLALEVVCQELRERLCILNRPYALARNLP